MFHEKVISLPKNKKKRFHDDIIPSLKPKDFFQQGFLSLFSEMM